jgi:hypothetical protein
VDAMGQANPEFGEEIRGWQPFYTVLDVRHV